MSAATDLTALDSILDYGDRALLLQFDRAAEVLAWTAALREAALPGVTDIVPASRTILVKLTGPRHQAATAQRLRRLRVDPAAVRTAPSAGRVDAVVDVVIDVVYDGPDLDVVAGRVGLSVEQVIQAHTAAPWLVAFNGSTPGFAYLIGGDPRLVVPRRAEQRPEVPAGAVALAGEFTGIYPRRAPGGWQLLGRTDAALWDLNRPSPTLLTPGLSVQFRAV